MEVPEAIVKRIYVKNSLRNVDSGFAFKLRNTLLSGKITAVGPITADGKTVMPDSVLLRLRDSDVPALTVNPDSPLETPAGVELEVFALGGDVLPAGTHEIKMSCAVAGLGPVTFRVVDRV